MNMAVYHAIERTSPKGPGSQFLGTCRLCGIQNLPASAARLECENPRGLTNDEALLETIEGVKVEPDCFDGPGAILAGKTAKG